MVGPVAISKDDVFHVLQNGRRRAVMRYLLANPRLDRITTRDLSVEVGSWEYGTTDRELSSEQRQRVYIALCQLHLPTLDENDVVNFDADRGIVEPGPLLSVFEPYLGDGLHDVDDSFSVPDAVRKPEAAGRTTAIRALFSK